MRRALAAVFAAGWLLVAPGGAGAQSGTPPAVGDSAASAPAPEGVPHLVASLDTTATTVGGALTLTLETEALNGWQLEPPSKSLDLGPFRVRTVERIPRPDGAAWKLRLVAVKAGDGELPPVRLTARGPAGESAEAVSEAIPVSIASNLPPPSGDQPEEPAPAPLKPALEPPRDWRPLAVAVLTAAIVAALGFWILRRLRRRKPREAAPEPARRVPLRPAWETALEALDRIAAADHPARGEIGRQYVEVTAVLRNYLEERYGVLAMESTTTELAETLRRTPMRPEIASRILALLREADLVKFAKAEPSAADARSTEGRAREAVTATIPKARETPVAEGVAA